MHLDKPFLNNTIKLVIATEFFNNHLSLGNKHSDLFKSSHPDRPEPEIPDAMLALATTAVGNFAALQHKMLTLCQVRCALRELSTGERENLTFRQSCVEDIYYSHCDTISGMRHDHPNPTHHILSQILSDVRFVYQVLLIRFCLLIWLGLAKLSPTLAPPSLLLWLYYASMTWKGTDKFNYKFHLLLFLVGS